MLYFSFGSNMSEKRLLQRIVATKIGVGVLTMHKLCFHKFAESDNSAKCDILKTENVEDLVYGVVYEIDESAKPTLDRIEGLGFGYNIKTVHVLLNGKLQEAYTYYATNINSNLKPYHWYKQHVLTGARENNFPKEYIASIENITSVKDKDIERASHELSIYKD